VTGHVGKDVINLNGLKAAVNVGIADKVRSYATISYLKGVDAIFGLVVPIIKQKNTDGNINVLSQIVSSLDAPIVSLYTYQDDASASSSSSQSGVGDLILGAEDLVNCVGDYIYVGQATSQLTTRVNSVVIGNTTVQFDAGVASLEIDDGYQPLVLTKTLNSALVNTTGARYKSGYYVVDCDILSSDTPIVLNVGKTGVNLSLVPADYVRYQSNYDFCYLNTYAGYSDSSTSVYFSLSQPVRNNHCVAHNIKDMTIGFSLTKDLSPSIQTVAALREKKGKGE